jgi:hypothetical protein
MVAVFRCTVEKGFVHSPNGMRMVKLNEEFEFTGKFYRRKRGLKKGSVAGEVDIPPGDWMDPVNDEAVAMVEAQIEAGNRQTVEASQSAVSLVVRPPKSGISLSAEQLHQSATAAPTVEKDAKVKRGPPRRRAKA